MMKILKLIASATLCVVISHNAFANDLKQRFKKDYAKLVYLHYVDAYHDARNLQNHVNQFLANPTEKNLELAKLAWLQSRDSYGQTEAFRFYEGPIDFVDQKTGQEGPEGRLNAWPLDESYIDYVKGNDKAGIVNNDGFAITKENLLKSNQEHDESHVSLGYHAIEFLLWGQDFSATSAGNRPASDYATNQKRRQYLKVASDILVDDVAFLKNEWNLHHWNFLHKNYAKKFADFENDKVIQNVLTSLATLSGFELASERMATALDSGDQEDEHSCFSDNTHHDFIYNQQGIKNVFLGDYKNFSGIGIYDILANQDPALADEILAQINEVETLLAAIPSPIDAQVLGTQKGSNGRVQMEKAVSALMKQAQLFLKAAQVLGVESQILN